MKLKITFNYLFLLLVLSVFTSSCKEDKLQDVENISGLGGETWAQSTIDKYISDSLTTPFNIAMKYKWDQYEFSDVTATLVPAKEEQIIPISQAIRRSWINPFVAQAGLVFFNKYSPKIFVLSGSAQFQYESKILGSAEGGRKIVLMEVNELRLRGMTNYVAARDSNNVKEFIRTIQHEFGHILHQNILYPVEFKTVGKGLYQGQNWLNISEAEARHDGFISQYASSGFDDDWVETIAYMLIEGKGGWDKIINSIPAGNSINGTSQATAQAILRRKEALVVNYFKTAWGIDFYSLQRRTRAAVVSLI